MVFHHLQSVFLGSGISPVVHHRKLTPLTRLQELEAIAELGVSHQAETTKRQHMKLDIG